MDFERHPLYSWLSETRRDFHMHPELGHKEFRTTEKIKEILIGLGIELQPLPGLKTGAVGIAFGKPGGKVIGLRADIDALPMEEKNDVPYRSVYEGVMHSCGHDCHATIVLGVAKNLVEKGILKELKGTVKFIFQPAEETVSGALEVIHAGGLENPTVDRILAGHMNTDLPVGQVGLFKDVSHAAADTFRLIIQGKGVHGAYPHEGIDPILAGSHFVTAVQSIVSRNVGPIDSAVVTVGQFQAGTAPNIIPDQVLLTGTVRTFKPEVRDRIIGRLTEIASGLEKSFGVRSDYRFREGVPVCTNDAAAEVLGRENVHYMIPQMGGEDFGLFTQKTPGTFMRIGVKNPEKGIVHKGHSPHFDVDEASLVAGVEVFTEAIRAYLAD